MGFFGLLIGNKMIDLLMIVLGLVSGKLEFVNVVLVFDCLVDVKEMVIVLCFDVRLLMG